MPTPSATPDRAAFLASAQAALDSIAAPTGPIAGASSREWNDRMAAALRRCALEGHRTVALYGAGTHTRALGETLREPPVRVACIIDDGATPGQTLWGYPVFTPALARALPLDVIVLSGNSVEHLLWDAAADFRRRGIPVIRVYTTEPAPSRATVAA